MYKLNNQGQIRQWQGHDFSLIKEDIAQQTDESSALVDAETQKKLEQLERDAYQQGYADAQSINVSTIEEKQKLSSLIQSLEKPLFDLNDQLQDTLLRLALQISEHILQREINQDISYYQNLVKQISTKGEHSTPTVFLCKETYDCLDKASLDNCGVDFQIDPNLPMHSSFLETEGQLFDISLNTLTKRCLVESSSAANEGKSV